MQPTTPFLDERRAESASNLQRIREAIDQKLSELDLKLRAKKKPTDLSQICIYATGSYGRGEASSTSDIDLFILDVHPEGRKGKKSLTDIDQIRLKAALVDVCEHLDLPEFDGDGRFLTVHLFEEMLAALGGDRDDASNFFTARLLLLLESQPLYNQSVYNEVVKVLLDEYFKDFTGHEKDFVPAYLVNDMVRFWKTLCLNYEHARRTEMSELQSVDDEETLKIKYKLKNLKLGFSRIMTCFSALTLLVCEERKRGAVVLSDVDRIVKTSPIDRLILLSGHPDLFPSVSEVLTEYSWFLEHLGNSKEALKKLESDDVREEAFDHVALYRESFYRLLTQAGEGGRLVTFVTM